MASDGCSQRAVVCDRRRCSGFRKRQFRAPGLGLAAWCAAVSDSASSVTKIASSCPRPRYTAACPMRMFAMNRSFCAAYAVTAPHGLPEHPSFSLSLSRHRYDGPVHRTPCTLEMAYLRPDADSPGLQVFPRTPGSWREPESARRARMAPAGFGPSAKVRKYGAPYRDRVSRMLPATGCQSLNPRVTT